MQEIFRKKLTHTDVNYRFSIPTGKLEYFEIPAGEFSRDVNVTDLNNEDHRTRMKTFKCSKRENGYDKPVLPAGWTKFVREKGLRIGDQVIFSTQEAGAGSYALCIRAQKLTSKLFGQAIYLDV
ncbi:B3 domain-containing protein Os02g0764100-like [Ricinus communis]|uniref:B3 domain-containing protein Os02g0764100-like n=1 Tax=Ricinus communis TaxID=3988 RepID=UPI00201B0644|nr:B3 domain-containing protein Os02g0764100-like [Ricinus communis]